MKAIKEMNKETIEGVIAPENDKTSGLYRCFKTASRHNRKLKFSKGVVYFKAVYQLSSISPISAYSPGGGAP